MQIDYTDKDLNTKAVKGTPYEVLSSWAIDHFPCFHKKEYDMIDHISKVCQSRYNSTFKYNPQDNIDDTSISILAWLKKRGNKIDIK